MIVVIKKQLGRIRRALQGRRDSRELIAELPTTLTKMVIGKTVKGQDIISYRFGNGKEKVVLVSGIHGNEVGTVKLGHHLTHWLNEHHQKLSNLTIYVIPCLNLDGYTQALIKPDYLNGGRIGRFNANKVDLNRNFPTKSWQSQSDWTHGKNYQERTTVFCGDKPGSEPELQAMLSLIDKEKIKTYIAFHSAGRDVMGNGLPRAQKLAKLFSKASGFRYSDAEEWESLKQTGTAKEWTEEQGIDYLEIEATVRWGSDWHNQKEAIVNVLKELNS